MTREIKVPVLAESISEAVVVAWLKPDGAAVAEDEPVVTLETDKAAVEIPSGFAGLLRHARALGERVEVGDVLARVEEGAGAAASAPPGPSVGPAPDAAAAATPRPSAAPATPAPARPVGLPAADRPLSPAVRRMVEEHGVNPAGLVGSGPGGRVLKEDVQRVIRPAPPAPAPSPASASPPGPARATTGAPPVMLGSAGAPTDWGGGETAGACP